MSPQKTPFLDSIYKLRTEECITIYTSIIEINAKEIADVSKLLKTDYENEKLNYPFESPEFDTEAAIWSAKVVYYSAQLVLIRENTQKDLLKIFPDFSGDITASTLLSADLCLRFLPQILKELELRDTEDPLNKILKDILTRFHYSSIGTEYYDENTNWESLMKNKTLKQLYLNRIVEKKDYSRAQIPFWKNLLTAALGDNKNYYWKELNF